MAKRIGGGRRKTRHIFQSPVREKGKISIRRYLDSFKPGERVVLKSQPAVQEGLYYRRFHGKSGIISKKQGECYLVAISDGKLTKEIVTHPAHLKRV